MFKYYETHSKINCLHLDMLGSDMHLYIGSVGSVVTWIVRQFLHEVTICTQPQCKWSTSQCQRGQYSSQHSSRNNISNKRKATSRSTYVYETKCLCWRTYLHKDNMKSVWVNRIEKDDPCQGVKGRTLACETFQVL